MTDHSPAPEPQAPAAATSGPAAATSAPAAAISGRTIRSLNRLADDLELTAAELEGLAPRARDLANSLEGGADLVSAIGGEQRPLVITVITALTERLNRAGSEVRRAEAHQLRSEGYTQERIAQAFSVTRQRAAALLKSPPDR